MLEWVFYFTRVGWKKYKHAMLIQLVRIVTLVGWHHIDFHIESRFKNRFKKQPRRSAALVMTCQNAIKGLHTNTHTKKEKWVTMNRNLCTSSCHWIVLALRSMQLHLFLLCFCGLFKSAWVSCHVTLPGNRYRHNQYYLYTP